MESLFSSLKRIFALSLVVVLSSTSIAFALTPEQRTLINSGIRWYDPDGSGASCNVSLSGNNNAQKTFNYLVSKGFTVEQAAGFVGNFDVETAGTFDPAIANYNGSGARGLAQWEGSRLDRLVLFADATNGDPFTLDTQLLFIWFELVGEPPVDGVSGGTEGGAYSRISSTDTVSDAAYFVSRYYERNAVSIEWVRNGENPATFDSAYGERIRRAELAYDQYAGAAASVQVGQNCSGLGINADGFVFPIASTQGAVSWCGQSLGNCHGTNWYGTYYAYDIWESRGGGASVVAVKDGYIRRFHPEYSCPAPQLSMWLEDDDGTWYFYQHLDANYQVVGLGDRVSAGQELGVIGPNAYVGATCSNTSPHLHFAASEGGRTTMWRGCTQSECPEVWRLIDIAAVLRSAYENLPL